MSHVDISDIMSGKILLGLGGYVCSHVPNVPKRPKMPKRPKRPKGQKGQKGQKRPKGPKRPKGQKGPKKPKRPKKCQKMQLGGNVHHESYMPLGANNIFKSNSRVP